MVLAAGRGSRMTDLTNHYPKTLLPIANAPLVAYPLHLLQQAGFKEAIVITSDVIKPKLKEVSNRLKMHLDLVDIPDEEWGTADSLRYIHEKIKSDVLVISGDLVADVSLSKMASVHRTHGAALTALFAPMSASLHGTVVPGSKVKYTPELDFVGLDTETSRLLFLSSEADLDESLLLRKNLLQKHPRMTVHSRLIDAHLYLMKKGVVDWLVKEKSMSSLKGEVIPYIIKQQFVPKLKKKTLHNQEATGDKKVLPNDLIGFLSNKQDDILCQIRDLSSWNDHLGDMEGSYHDDAIRCYGCLVDDGLCLRVNTLANFMEANKQLLAKGLVHTYREKTEVAKVGDASIMASSSTIGNKSRLKDSAVGSNCTIGDGVRLSNCVIMNNVHIEEECVVESSIICDQASLGSRATLRDCLVAANQKVDSSAKFSKDIITDVDHMMEIV